KRSWWRIVNGNCDSERRIPTRVGGSDSINGGQGNCARRSRNHTRIRIHRKSGRKRRQYRIVYYISGDGWVQRPDSQANGEYIWRSIAQCRRRRVVNGYFNPERNVPTRV